MRITEEIRGECGETCRRISGKARQFSVRAPVRFIHVSARTLPLLAGAYSAGF
jgi:hypothetical protein